ncbi:MAG: ketose-bisphosphate aldolase [Candidatus Onthovivens sp.]|nr:ketose-bisphosphate aldolase [Candidatus Onthovivens sp.]MDY4936656.1 ketose-bisphosphate aldolase [Candidatus Onthovivens sp.]
MPLVSTKELLKKAYEGKYAVGAFNVDNMDILKAVLRASEDCKSPVIIAISGGALDFFGEDYLRPILDAAMKTFTIPVALHLDHGKSVELCKKCVDLGFTSVMIDASAYDFETNIKMTKEVVDYAHARGVSVEGELGAIAGIEDDVVVDDKYGNFTHPNDAVEFVKRTGIDSLAIAIGTAHGAYKFKPGQKPQLRFDILEEIEQKMPGYPLVLHGASSVPKKYLDILNSYGGTMKEAIGIPESMLKEASQHAICKINVGTDIRVAFIGGLRKSLSEFTSKFDCRTFFTPALDQVYDLVKDKIINVFGSNNKAE